MKKKYLLIFFLFLSSGGCYEYHTSDSGPAQYYALKAVTITKDSLRKSVHSEAARDLHATGKIYIYKNYLFVVEPGLGIHVYDDADPVNPINISFIAILACGDIAVKYNTLYADNAIDMVALDITDPKNPKVTSRNEDVFPDITPSTDHFYYSILYNPDPANFVTIGWKDTLIVQ
jgi:hypothetical protein